MSMSLWGRDPRFAEHHMVNILAVERINNVNQAIGRLNDARVAVSIRTIRDYFAIRPSCSSIAGESDGQRPALASTIIEHQHQIAIGQEQHRGRAIRIRKTRIYRLGPAPTA